MKRAIVIALGAALAAFIYVGTAQADSGAPTACATDSDCAYNQVCTHRICVPDGRGDWLKNLASGDPDQKLSWQPWAGTEAEYRGVVVALLNQILVTLRSQR